MTSPSGGTAQRQRAIWIIGGRLSLVVSSVVGVRLLTEFLSPGEVGRMSLVLSVYQWFSFLFVSPVGLFVMRHANSWSESGLLVSNLRRMNMYFLFCAVLVAGAVAFLQSQMSFGIAIAPAWIAWLVGGHLLFIVLAGTNSACLNNLGRSFWFVALGNLAAWAGLVLAAFLVNGFGGRAEIWLTGILIGYVISSAVSFIVLRIVSAEDVGARAAAHKISLGRVTQFSWRPLLAFAGPIVPITLVYWCQTDGFRFIVQRQVGADQLGLFLIAFSLGGTPVVAAERLLVDLLSPDFYRRIASKDLPTMKAAWTSYVSSLLPSILIAVAFVSATGPLLARVLVSQRFHAIGAFAVYGAVFRGIFAATSAFLLWTHAIEKTSSPLPAYTLGALVALLGVYLLSPRSPMSGTGITLIASSACTLCFVAATIKRRYAIDLPWGRLGLAAAVSLPLILAAVVIEFLVPTASKGVVCVILIPLALYCGAASALFAGLFGENRRWRWAAAQLTRKRAFSQTPIEADAEIQSPSPLV